MLFWIYSVFKYYFNQFQPPLTRQTCKFSLVRKNFYSKSFFSSTNQSLKKSLRMLKVMANHLYVTWFSESCASGSSTANHTQLVLPQSTVTIARFLCLCLFIFLAFVLLTCLFLSIEKEFIRFFIVAPTMLKKLLNEIIIFLSGFNIVDHQSGVNKRSLISTTIFFYSQLLFNFQCNFFVFNSELASFSSCFITV